MTTALYRRYRPETFAEVIGQEHVTAPLMQALRSGRVNHAYLFSGPRGCGKTTSARILARTLNCARNTPETPIDTPCGECPSCVELARGGPGSLDVVEIDAASHNGVDDARDLRERATFAPARDRYKIFILDEAHMVTPQGFNALLKIVEEPPPHVKFVFATTEPDKVIGTIRSRTHHYPFRLVPPDVLGPYLEQLTAAEGIELGGGVVPLVTRAGGGSVRDSLSVLDQLIAGATGGTVEYDTAVGLLGFTHATLLDDVIDALAASDGASIFRVVDQVISTGHEPRRFVEDVLERLRDLIVIGVSGDAAEAVLRGLPADQLERMRTQAGRLGVAELSRAADLVNAALTEMTGATSPRLHLELLCARLLLPGADDGAEGLAARIDRLERGVIGSAPVRSAPAATGDRGPATDAPPAGAPAAGGLSGAAAARAALQASRRPVDSAEQAETAVPAAAAAPAAAVPERAGSDASAASGLASGPAGSGEAPQDGDADTLAEDATPVASEVVDPEAVDPEPPVAGVEDLRAVDAEPDVAEPDDAATDDAATDGAEPVDAQPVSVAAVEPPVAGGAPGATAEMVRRRWDEVVANIGSPVTRALVGPNAQVTSLEGGLLRLGFAAPGMARTFSQPRHVDAVSESVYQTLGVQVRVEATVDEGRSGGGSAPSGGDPGGPPPEDPDPEPAPSADDSAERSGFSRASGNRPGGDRPAGTGPTGFGTGGHGPGGRSSGDDGASGFAPTAGGNGNGNGSGGWPDVPAPGAGQGRPSAPVAATPVATVAAAKVAAAGPRSPGTSGATAAGVALAERPTESQRDASPELASSELASSELASAEPTSAEPTSAEPVVLQGRAAASARTAAEDADAAWLAGASTAAAAPRRATGSSAPAVETVPPSGSRAGDPSSWTQEVRAPAPSAPSAPGPAEPNRSAAAPSGPARSASATAQAAATPSGAPPSPAAPPPTAPAPTTSPAGAPAGSPVRETPRQAAERRVREAQQAEARPAWGGSSGPGGMDDEPSADDPDITSTGLVGVQLVVQVLGGKVIEEIAEQP
ncbi:DNA polymerase III subunit gamma and tau [Isoptericola sp. NPDC055881]